MKIDDVDEAIMAAFQADGRQSNREVARRLGVSEGTVRQRLKKLQDAGAIRFDVVTDPVYMGIDFVAFVRVSVSPRHLETFLAAAARLPDVWYLAAMVGRFNVQAIICTTTAQAAMQMINAEIETLEGVNEVQIRPGVGHCKQDVHEVVVPARPASEAACPSATTG